MGSKSDLGVMTRAADVLDELEIGYEVTIASAHRVPDKMIKYVSSARERGIKVIIAGAGGAAHLPGMAAAMTTLPIIGVPIKASISLDGWDSILSILQMPGGVPVATVGLDNAKNAGILAAQIIGTAEERVAGNLDKYKEKMRQAVEAAAQEVADKGFRNV